MVNILSEEGKEERRKYYRDYKANRTEEQKEKERQYIRDWRAARKETVAEYNRRYWEKKAARKEV